MITETTSVSEHSISGSSVGFKPKNDKSKQCLFLCNISCFICLFVCQIPLYSVFHFCLFFFILDLVASAKEICCCLFAFQPLIHELMLLKTDSALASYLVSRLVSQLLITVQHHSGK